MKSNANRLFKTITIVATLVAATMSIAHAESIEECVKNSVIKAEQAAEAGGADISWRDKQKDMAVYRNECVDSYWRDKAIRNRFKELASLMASAAGDNSINYKTAREFLKQAADEYDETQKE